MKLQIITWLVTLGALFDTIYSVFAENQGLLIELGISPKYTKIVMLLGLIWTAFSKSLTSFSESKKLIGDRPNDRK